MREMEIQFSDWRPCQPMRGIELVPAFVEIASPVLPREVSEGTAVLFGDGERDTELDKPREFAWTFLRDEFGHRGASLKEPPVLFGNGSEIGVVVADGCPVPHIIEQMGSSGADFEVEITVSRLGS